MKNLELRDLAKVYRRLPDRVLGFEDVNVVFRPGEVTGLLGPNGSGKSTLLKILATVLNGYQGEVFYGDEVISQARKKSFWAYRYRLGYLPESPFTFSKLTGMEYLRFVGDLYGIPWKVLEPRITRLLDLFELKEATGMFLSAYSTGMLKKVALIVALINDPDILLLDEPTNGLDPKGIATLESIVTQARQAGKIVLLSTHVLEVAQRLSDQIVIMQAGRTKWQGAVDDIPTSAIGTDRSSVEEFFFIKTEGEV